MPRIIFTASAQQDLDDIWDYIVIENHSPVAADRLIDEIDQQVQLLLSQPGIGEAVEKLRPRARRIIVNRRYLVFYDENDEGILVLRVFNKW